jgi:hypothetical protein
VQDQIAKTVRYGWVPEGKVAEWIDLSEQARRLDRALKVAEKWMEASFSTEATELFSRAQYTPDALQEELSRVCFQMEVEENKRVFGEEHEDKAEPSALSDALVEVFCILGRAPEHIFNDSSPRARYALMETLMVAQDAHIVVGEGSGPYSLFPSPAFSHSPDYLEGVFSEVAGSSCLGSHTAG